MITEDSKNIVPVYKPQHVLSPEFKGTSNYEVGNRYLLEEAKQKLAQLNSDPQATAEQIHLVEEDLKTLESLYENYHTGMNVFRTAKGGRDGIRE
ncbi:MAG: hypothetical protein ACREAG_04320 [Nitrosopumilaceae archaeon]